MAIVRVRGVDGFGRNLAGDLGHSHALLGHERRFA
jgi:hypothetical protein